MRKISKLRSDEDDDNDSDNDNGNDNMQWTIKKQPKKAKVK